MNQVTRNELRQILDALTEEVEVTIVSRTEPAMRKTGNPFIGKVFKVSQVKGTIAWHYAQHVQDQRQAEGGLQVVAGVPVVAEVDQFVAKDRKWGKRLKDSPFVEHKGNFYLEVKVLESLGHEYRGLDGELVEGKKLESLKSFFSKSSSKSRQGVKGEIILRDYRLDRVQALTFNRTGKTYLVTDNAATAAKAA